MPSEWASSSLSERCTANALFLDLMSCLNGRVAVWLLLLLGPYSILCKCSTVWKFPFSIWNIPTRHSYRGCQGSSHQWALVPKGALWPLCSIRWHQYYKWHIVGERRGYRFCTGAQGLQVTLLFTPKFLFFFKWLRLKIHYGSETYVKIPSNSLGNLLQLPWFTSTMT